MSRLAPLLLLVALVALVYLREERASRMGEPGVLDRAAASSSTRSSTPGRDEPGTRDPEPVKPAPSTTPADAAAQPAAQPPAPAPDPWAGAPPDPTDAEDPRPAVADVADDPDAAPGPSAETADLTGSVDGAPLADIPADAPADADLPGPRATLVPWAEGDAVEVVTVLSLSLDAEVDMGLFSPTSTYSSKEYETLHMRVLASADGERRSFTFEEARRVDQLPVVGRKEKQHRTHGKEYVVHDTGAADPVVSRPPTGKLAGPKSTDNVLRTWSSWSGAPPLHALLADHPGPLLPGVRLVAEAPAARRLLGLPVEQLSIDALTLTVVSAEDGVLVGEIDAGLSGQAELGSGSVALSGGLFGELRADLDTGRMTDLKLEGRVRVKADGQGLLKRGAGPLKLRRRVRSL